MLRRLDESTRSPSVALVDPAALRADLARLSGPDLEVMEGLADLLADDAAFVSTSTLAHVGQLAALLLACRRPAARLFRRRYLLALWRTPKVKKCSWLWWEGTTEDRLASAVSLAQALAQPASPAWRAAEAKVLWALPAQYQGGSPWFDLNPRPSVGKLLADLMASADPDIWLVGLRRWSTLSASIEGFDLDDGAPLASLPETTWRHLAALKGDPRDLAMPSPFAGRGEALGHALWREGGDWLAAVVPDLRKVGGTYQRMLSLTTVAHLSVAETRVGVEWATQPRGMASVEPWRLLQHWAALSTHTRCWVREALASKTDVTAALLECLVAADACSADVRTNICRALVGLAEEGDLGQLERSHLKTLLDWYKRTSDRLCWAKLLRLSTGSAMATRMHANYGDEIPEDVIALAVDCCEAQEAVEQQDPYYPTEYDDLAIVEACHRAYRLGLERKSADADAEGRGPPGPGSLPTS